MTSPLGIAAVSAVLRTVLNDGLTEANLASVVGGNVSVSSLPPDRVSINGAQEPNQLNLFLYHTTYNPGWRNAGLPSRSVGGERISNPPLALDLHYILSAYGAQDFAAEVILGHGMHALYEHSLVTRSTIRRALSPPLAPGVPQEFLQSHLADQVEQITVSPETLTTEEIARLWSAFQAHYRPSAAYQVTVVLLDVTRSLSAALPVRAVSSTLTPLQRSVIETVNPDTGPGTPILPDSTLVITGQGLRGTETRVLVASLELVPAADSVSDTRISVALPSPVPAALRAGAIAVHVAHAVPLGEPPDLRTFFFKSDAFVITLRPVITPSAQNVTSANVDGVEVRAGEMRVDFVPNVGRGQFALLLLNEVDPPSTRPARAYSFPAPVDNGIADPDGQATNRITFSFRGVVPGTYLVRSVVDGAESPLTPVNGVLTNPRVTV
jgi:Pvc16 N-terminal domain